MSAKSYDFEYDELPKTYEELSREYLKTRSAIRLLKQRVDTFHGLNDQNDLRALRAWSRRLAVARNRAPDKPEQMKLL